MCIVQFAVVGFQLIEKNETTSESVHTKSSTRAKDRKPFRQQQQKQDEEKEEEDENLRQRTEEILMKQ